jgi:hypothetical protein
VKYILQCWLILLLSFPAFLYASTQSQIFSLEAMLAIATYEKVYEFHDKESVFILGRETSYSNFQQSRNGDRFRYTITSRFPNGETIDEAVLGLPEIGDWSVLYYNYSKILYSKWDSHVKLYFYLQCKTYNGEIITYRFPLGYGVNNLVVNGTSYEMNNFSTFHSGSRSSLENLSHIRFAKKNLYKDSINNKKFEIFLTRDSIDTLPARIINNYDDLFFYHNDDTTYIEPAFLTCFIVPRIFFVKFEESSLSIDIMDDLSPLRFTIIVQQFENPEKTAWDYHRLEIVREQSSHEIQINDLGPLPRSEWTPGWPDPATTSLWKAPESECAQCE